MLTIAQWMTAWTTIGISGVAALTTPPLSLDRVDLPVGWPEEIGFSLTELIVSCLEENVRYRAVYRIAVGALGQKTLTLNYAETAALGDSINGTLLLMTKNLMNFFAFNVRLTAQIEVAGIQYWGFEIEATGRNV